MATLKLGPLCPLRSNGERIVECALGRECAWWVEDQVGCAVKAMAESLALVEKTIFDQYQFSRAKAAIDREKRRVF